MIPEPTLIEVKEQLARCCTRASTRRPLSFWHCPACGMTDSRWICEVIWESYWPRHEITVELLRRLGAVSVCTHACGYERVLALAEYLGDGLLGITSCRP